MYAERKYENNNDKIRLIVFKCHITYLLQKIVYMFILLIFWIMRYGYNYNEIYSTMTYQIIITIINKIVKISSIKKEIEENIYANCCTS